MEKDKTENLKKSLGLFGKEYIRTIAKKLQQADKRASGSLINSLSSDAVYVADELELHLSAEKYIDYVNKGRRPGSWPNISAILRWTALKGIPESAVFPIAHSIYKFGIKPTNIIDDTFDASLTALRRNAEDGWSKDVEDLLDNLAKQE